MINIFSNAFGSSATISPFPFPSPHSTPPLLAASTRSDCGDRYSMEYGGVQIQSVLGDIALSFLLRQNQDSETSEQQFEATFCNQSIGLQLNHAQNAVYGRHLFGSGSKRGGCIKMWLGPHFNRPQISNSDSDTAVHRPILTRREQITAGRYRSLITDLPAFR